MVDGLAHGVLHVLEVGEVHRDGDSLAAFVAAFARQHHQVRRGGVGGRRAGQLHGIAFADGAFGAGRVHQIQILAGHEHVLNAVTEHPADATVGRIGLIVGGHGLRFLIFERHLPLHFGGDLPLDVGSQRHSAGAGGGLRLHSGIRRISRGQVAGR